MSDVLNGLNLINEGNPIWGGVIIGLIFLPMTVFLGLIAIETVFDKKRSCCNRVLFLLLLPLLFPLAVALATLAYILFVAYVFARRVVQPGYVSTGLLGRNNEGRYGQRADQMKLLEAVFEANLQAVTGAHCTFEISFHFAKLAKTFHSFANSVIDFKQSNQ